MNDHKFNELIQSIGTFDVSLKDIFEENQINEFTGEQLKCICLKAVEFDGDDLASVPKPIDGKPLSDSDYLTLSFKAVENSGVAIKHVPILLRTFALYLKAVKQHGSALRYLPPYSLESTLKEKDYIQLWQEALKTFGLGLKEIPIKYRGAQLCKIAVAENANAFKLVPEPEESKDAIISPQEYAEICVITVKTDGLFLELMRPNPFITIDLYQQLCFLAIKQNALAIKYVDPAFLTVSQYIDLLLMAVRYNGLALQYVPVLKDGKPFNKDVYLNIVITAVIKNANALKYIADKEIKEQVIEAITPLVILSNSYQAINYFPEKYHREQILRTFLSGIEHVVVVSSDSIENNEIQDSYLVYANKEKRRFKTLIVEDFDIEPVLHLMKEQKLVQDINLVLLDHAQQYNNEICGMKIEDIVDLIDKFTQIKHVTFLGCVTVKARSLKSEQLLLKQFKPMFDSINNKQCFLMLSLSMPEEQVMTKYLSSSYEAGYFLYKDTHKDSLILEYKTIQGVSTKVNLSEQHLRQLFNALGKPRHQFPTSEKGFELFDLLSQKTKIWLWALQTDLLSSLKRSDSVYKGLKKSFPFLTKGFIQSEEADKLEESLLKKLFLGIINNPHIDRDIVLKGYTRGLYVDVKSNRFYLSDTNIYSENYTQSFFATPDANIEDQELDAMHVRLCSRLLKDETSSESQYKSLVTVTKSNTS